MAKSVKNLIQHRGLASINIMENPAVCTVLVIGDVLCYAGFLKNYSVSWFRMVTGI